MEEICISQRLDWYTLCSASWHFFALAWTIRFDRDRQGGLPQLRLGRRDRGGEGLPATRTLHALRAAGVEVWFDKSELRGGEAWDAAIRQQIKTCTLFVPVISRNTQARDEGYFRLEWKLAVDRSHLIAADRAFPFAHRDRRDRRCGGEGTGCLSRSAVDAAPRG
jgi:hypothetical protein